MRNSPAAVLYHDNYTPCSRSPFLPTIRVIIGEDDPHFRGALIDLVNSEPGLELVGAAADADGAIALARSLGPDVALLDVKMPGGGGPAAARAIRASCPHTRTIALTAFHDRATIVEMLSAGAAGYLVKGTPVEEIITAILRTADGETTLSRDAAAVLVRMVSSQLESEERESQHWRRRTAEIDEVVSGRGLRIEFQPVVHLPTRATAGEEALARFPQAVDDRSTDPASTDPGATEPASTEPEPIDLAPATWFDDARRLGRGPDLELAAASLALVRLGDLPADQFLCLNVSPETAASPRLLELVSGAAPDRIVLEITQSAAEHRDPDVAGGLEALRALGVRLAVDDMGAGVASLRQLLWLQPHFIKLDIWLTQSLESGPAARGLAAALLHFAGDVGATVIAEGVESAGQLDALASLGVPYGQGFLLGRGLDICQ